MKIEIPDDVLFKAEVLGYLPEEYVEPAVRLITSQDPSKMGEKIDELLPKFQGIAADSLLRTLMQKGDANVRSAVLKSKEVRNWTIKNHDRLHNAIIKNGTW